MSMNITTENPFRIMGTRGGTVRRESMRPSGGNGALPPAAADGVAQELGMLLRNQPRLDTLLSRKETVPYRSGSAPPSVEGSRASMGGLFPPAVETGVNVDLSGSGESVNSSVESEQDLRCDPAYLTYYYSHVNLNPRLPPPIISRDNYLLAQRLANGGISDKRRLTSFDDSSKQSLFSMQALLPTHDETEVCEHQKSQVSSLPRQSCDVGSDAGLSATNEHGFVTRPKSLVDLIQQDFPRTPSPVYSNSRPPSRLANEESASGGESHLRDSAMASTAVAELVDAKLLASVPGRLSSSSSTPTPLDSLLATHKSAGVHSVGGTSLSSSGGHLGPIARIPIPDLSNNSEPLIEDISGLRMGVSSSQLKGISRPVDSSGACALELAASLQELTLLGKQGSASTEHQGVHPIDRQHDSQGQPSLQQVQRHLRRAQSTQSHLQVGQAATLSISPRARSQASALEQNIMAQCKYGVNPSASTPIQSTAGSNIYAAAMSYMAAGNAYYSAGNVYATPYGLGGYPVSTRLMPGVTPNYTSTATYENAAAALASGIGGRPPGSGLSSADLQQLYKYTSQTGGSLLSRLPDPLYLHYLQNQTVNDHSTNEHPFARGYGTGTHLDSLELQKSQLSSMLGYSSENKSQFGRTSSVGLQIGSQCNSVSPAYYGSPPGSFGMPYPTSPLSSPVLPDSPVLPPGSLSLRHGGRSVGWQGARPSDIPCENLRAVSLLDELKNCKSRRFELEVIAGHVVEFSADQHGSRFIQQKLETASAEEKAMVFREVSPHTLTLMTDVFGNYVIQKFFEHGSVEQRTELANKLIGHVLDLSLQMYGCRVIQKALEVVSTEQQIQLISELDGNVMRCVRDQNGNHVIQKCIECVPPEHIQFIISAFRGQVIMLSTHPYGCRVIQRVLEHCTDEQKQDGIMDDILHAACELAQDQYGNYVVQHVLGHGKPHEKGKIMTKLAGQIVQMSQHKFASNVVEKCLEFGGPAERQILITEMLGHTDENEPLQAMMKDQYANYVVQKVLETCDDKQRELLLSRIRVHLHALKKYTYGKHIVARVEKLLAAGERRSAQMTTV